MALESSAQARSTSSYQRRRAGNACLVCRSRKTKCDNQRPVCGFCAATGGDCVYVDSDPSQFDRASLAILQRLGQLEATVVTKIEETFGRTTSTETRYLAQVAPESHQNAASKRDQVQQTFQVVEPSASPNDQARAAFSEQNPRLYERSNDSPIDMPPSSTVIAQTSRFFMDSMLKWPIFSQAAPHLKTELHLPAIEILGRPERNRRQWQDTTIRTANTHLNLNPGVVDQLVENFIANNHVKNPILDIQSLRADVREFAETGPQWDERSCLIVSVL